MWWVITGTTGACVKNYATGEYLTNKASSMASNCNSTNQYWNFTAANYGNIGSN